MKTIPIAVLLCVASIGFIAWRISVRSQDVIQQTIVKDPSGSHPDGCDSLLGLTKRALHVENLSSKSLLNILVLGDAATTNNEPWRLGEYAIPKSTRVLEGVHANERREQDLLRDVWQKCQNISPTGHSPIVLGVKAGIAQLRADGCSETGRCKLYIDSDGEETGESAVMRSLKKNASPLKRSSPMLDNRGIEVDFCGVAVMVGKLVDASGKVIYKPHPRDAGREDRIQQVWRSIFTKPELVRFEPFCPKQSVPSETTKGRNAESKSLVP